MLHQIFSTDVATIKAHLDRHRKGNGPMVVARVAAMVGTPQVHDVREANLNPTRQQQAQRLLQGLPLLPNTARKRLEVQLSPHGGQPWHTAETLFLKEEEKQDMKKRTEG